MPSDAHAGSRRKRLFAAYIRSACPGRQAQEIRTLDAPLSSLFTKPRRRVADIQLRPPAGRALPVPPCERIFSTIYFGIVARHDTVVLRSFPRISPKIPLSRAHKFILIKQIIKKLKYLCNKPEFLQSLYQSLKNGNLVKGIIE